MTLIAFCFFALVVAASGYVVAGILFAPARWTVCELLGFCLLAGIGAIAFTLFLLSLLTVTPNRQALICILIACAIAVLLLRKRARTVRLLPLIAPQTSVVTIAGVIPIAAVAFCFIAAAVNALQYPLYEWDAFSIWFLKAEIFLHEPLLPRPHYFGNPAMSYSHRDYPPLVPMYVTGLWAALGSANDRWGRCALLLPYAGMTLIFFADARRRISSAAGLWLTGVYVCTPALAFWAPSGDADVTLAAFYTAHLVYLARWLETRRRCDLLAAGLFACWLWLTKQEGEVLALVSAAIVLIVPFVKERRFNRSVLLLPATLVILLLPWHVWSWNLPHSAARFPQHITPNVIIENLPSLWPTLRMIFAEMLHWQSWGFLFPLLLIVGVLTPRRIARTDVLVLWLLLLAQMGLYAAIGTLSLPYMKANFPPTLPRFFVQTLPIVAMLILAHWPPARADRLDSSGSSVMLTA